ncbi:uncharacterized protein LOC127792062 [Diospyros lotus]|uniref:uncharacterized protein LOC127792062 n=1 Tax=Diospyros lotus TaxID=55363 RepID=UPI0022575363|nr:uncharacterized protein LOC127792062 [Diospyros lotus]
MEEACDVEQTHKRAREQDDSPQDCHQQMCNQEDGEESSLVVPQQQSRRPNLSSLQIPARSMENTLSNFSPSSNRAGLPPRPNSAKFKSSVRNLLPQRSFRGKGLSQDGEKTVLILPDTPLSERPSTSRSFSLNKVFVSSSTKSAHSLPVTPVANSGLQTTTVVNLDKHSEISNPEIEHHMKRSFSVPVNIKTRSFRRMNSTGGLIRIISAKPHPETVDDGAPANKSTEINSANEGAEEDIPEEEAVCRICLVELGEGGETLKMECSCKGELALAHKECAVKWFSIKGNKTCDVCKQDVRNLPVTLLKIQNPRTVIRHPRAVQDQREIMQYRIWQDVPILVMVSMLAYFCFLEQLLVSDLGPRALAVSLPFACVLGLLSSMIASTMVSKSYIWAYSSFQFAIVILFAHIFYTMLNVSPILSVLLSSFSGFGIAISTNTLVLEYMRWRASRNLGFPHRHGNDVAQWQLQHNNQLHQNQRQHQRQQQQSVENITTGSTDGAGYQEIRIQTT